MEPGRRGLRDRRRPAQPSCTRCRRLAAELGDDLPIAWRHRSERYTEKLATPDTSVGDLVGDVDPVKVAQGRTLGDPETVHYGLVPRTNRGIFGLNELPDLAERIQVALFNVLEERDIQIRGYSLRLPLDLLLVATANPEDYTNRGRIITPLKDRFGAEIRTHYPSEVTDEVALIAQESAARRRRAGAPARGHRALHPRAARVLRRRPALRRLGALRDRWGRGHRRLRAASRRPRRRGVCRRAGLRRPHRRAHPPRQGRVRDGRGGPRARRPRAPAAARGRRDLSRRASPGLDLTGFTDLFAEGAVVETGELVPGRRPARPGRDRCSGLSKVLDRLGHADDASPGQVAAAIEFVLEGLHLTRRIDKDSVAGRTVYGA